MKAFIIIPAHNRKRTTLACLRHLRKVGALEWATVLLVDDGSTDGTTPAVAAEFPDVQVLTGDGNLWWGGAINLGIKTGMERSASHLIWLNDDCIPHPGSLEILVRESDARAGITVGQARLLETGELCYGGHMRGRGVHLQLMDCKPGEVKACDTFSGNCVCIPADVVRRIGLIDAATLPHAWGDHDYGFRAKAAGVTAWVVGSVVCDSTYGYLKNRMSWLLGDLGVGALWSLVFAAPGGCLSWPGWTYHIRWYGFSGFWHQVKSVLRLLATTLLRVTVPRPWLVRGLSGFSRSYKRMEQVRAWSKSNEPSLSKSEP